MAVTDHTAQPASADRRRTIALAAGDLLAFHIVTAVGLLSHSRLASLEGLIEVATIATPLAAGWFVVAPFLGLFRPAVAGRVGPALGRTALAWLLALPISLLLWALVRQKSVQWVFALVTFVTNLIALLGWRGLFAWLFGRVKA